MASAAVYIPRLALLQAQLQPHQGFLLTDPHDLRYFSGFLTLVPEEREAYLVVTKTEAYLLYSSFSPLPEPLEVKALVGTFPRQVTKHLEFIAKEFGIKELLIDKTRLFVLEYEALVKDSPLKFESLDKKILWLLRHVKDGSEIDAIQRAGKVAAQAYQEILPLVKVGITERELQLELEAAMRHHGSYHTAFPTIVAFGAHAALPHHQPSDLALEDNTAVLIDFGATVDGYRSDMTRSFWFGTQPDPNYLEIKNLVDEAYAAVKNFYTEAMTEGRSVTAGDLDRAAREVISQAGHGDHFIHTTGHGVGLDIHEPPSISSQNPFVIQPNVVITVEPGIYLPGRFGYRYENTMLTTTTELVELTLGP